MNYLYDSALAQPLLAFAFAYYIVIVIGAEIRKRNPALAGVLGELDGNDYRRVQKNRFCRLLSLGFISIIVCFSLFPIAYKQLGPIVQLRYPVYNLFGLVLLAVAFVKMLLVQVDMDKDMYHHNMLGRQMTPAAITNYSRRMLAGYYTMFVGLTLILSNWASVLLLVLAAIAYREK